ncbi:MAG: lipid-A-disaccharide synthase-related protein [Halanaerobiales bacterium]|nr:lipid-A-disaccharide synthase-related protein [Halanaerobiales bacterium]
MNEKKKVLVISNGHGEDIISSNLIKSLYKNFKTDELEIDVFPFVGEGKDFNSLDVNKIGPTVKLPSGGFARNSLSNLWKDLKAGLLSNTFKQIKTLRKAKNSYESTIVVGDVYILFLTGFFKGGNIIFLPTAKSEYIDGHYKIEKNIMRKYASLVLPRDKKTKDDLIQYGINAEFYGNLMMDCFEIKDLDFQLKDESTKIGILPGSRKEAYDNMIDFMKVIEELEKIETGQFDFLTAVAGGFSIDLLKSKVIDTSWEIEDCDQNYTKLKLHSPKGNNIIHIIFNGFGDVLDQAKLFLGMAGTANEQAAGMGKPVIIFPGTGAQFDYEFAADQKRLLGDGVKFLERNFKNVAYSILELLEDKEEYKKRSKFGKTRMGERGVIDKTSQKILEYL